jgi:ferric iron reductase protein FhuF
MIPALAPCFPDALAYYGDKLALPGAHGDAIAGTDLLEGGAADRLMSRFAQTHRGGDRHAVVSMWTQWHFGALIIPTTAAILVLDRDLPIDLAQIRIAPHEEGRTAALVVPDDGKPREAGSDRFSRLFDGHVAPLIRHFASHFGVSPRLLWINATAIFEWSLEQVAAANTVHPDALREGRALLAAQTDATGRRNPMCGAVCYPLLAGQPTRRRKICCLRYLLPGVADCGSLCPLPEANRAVRPVHS